MLPKTSRFTRREFDLLLQTGRSRNYPLFSVRYAGGFSGKKAAVVVSKKEASLASKRNTGRRRTYAAIAPVFSLIPAKTGVAFFLRKDALKATPAELRAAIAEALRAFS